MSFMNRRFTLREKILMIVLVVVLFLGIYFLLVYYPIQNERNELEEQRQQLANDRIYWDARKQIYDNMQEGLKDIYATPVDERTEIPKFDGKSSDFESMEDFLSIYFTEIFARLGNGYNPDSVDGWNNSVDVPDTNGIKSKTLSIRFNVKGVGDEFTTSYAITKELIHDLLNVGEYRSTTDENGETTTTYVRYRCLMNSLRLSALNNENLPDDDGIHVECSITFYER